MTATPPTTDQNRERLFTFRSGGWVLVVTGIVCLAMIGWAFASWLSARGTRIGDGTTLASYGYDLSTTLVPRDELIPAGISKNREIRAIENAAHYSLAEVDRQTAEERGKYLVSSDRVIGVALNGEVRAYPLNILFVHEIVNDELGGVPIVITYNPLADSSVVFDRQVNGETLTFGVSGLVYNSNLVMFDERNAESATAESLWSQVQARAIAGPAAAAGETLRIIPAQLMSWAEWRAIHPETTVLARDPDMKKRYKRTYNQYFDSDKLHFPVEPLPPDDGVALKSRMIVVFVDGAPHGENLDQLLANADAEGRVVKTIGGRSIEFTVRADPLVGWARDASTGELLSQLWCARFAWWSMVRPE